MHTRVQILLLALSGLWFFTGIISSFGFAFIAYGAFSSGRETTMMDWITLALLLAFPVTCGHTIIHAWRRFIAQEYELAWKIALIPFPVLAVVLLLVQYGAA